MKSKFFKFIILLSCLILLILTVAEPEVCRNAAINGILLCGRVIIPSLFPFTAILLFIMESISRYTEKLTFITKPILMLSGEMACITLFSFLGGYPVGAKLLNDAAAHKKITSETGSRMLNFCVNAGPAFVISAVGAGIMGSKILGVILLISHISASVIILFLHRPRLKNCFNNKTKDGVSAPFTDRFVAAVASASSSTMSICSFVILFSVITAYARLIPNFDFLVYLLEVTTAVTKTGNIYLISFLLGFSGLSVWCQILSNGKNLKIKLVEFAFFRILHGVLSGFITALIIKLSGIAVPVISNGVSFSFKSFYSTPALSISLFIMALLLLISLFSKKQAGKLLEDVV